MDENSCGSLSFQQFKKLIDKHFKINIDLFAKNLFIDLDSNKMGYVTFDFLDKIFELGKDTKKYFVNNKINNQGKCYYYYFIYIYYIVFISLFIDFLLLVKQNLNLFLDDESIHFYLWIKIIIYANT